MTPRIVSVAAVLLLLVVYQVSSASRRHVSSVRSPPCCVKVSRADIGADVIGDTYRKQVAKPPCVEAILLDTKDGETCVDPKAKWVKDVIANMTKTS